MPDLFGRRLDLIVGGKEIGGVVTGRDVSGLRVAFRATKDLTPKPNAIEIRVWNLSPETRAAAMEKGAKVMLSAGYESDLGLIFVGDVTLVTHAKEGADWVTTLQGGDGLTAVQTGRIHEAFAAGAKLKDVIRKLGERMKVSTADALAAIRSGKIEGLVDEFTNGLVASGALHEEFNRLARISGFEWSIQDGALQVLPKGKADSREAVVLSETSGLIGSPVPAIKPVEGGGRKNIIRARSLLNSELRPGRVVQIRSAQLDGWYRVEMVQASGDTHGPDWFSDIEAVPL